MDYQLCLLHRFLCWIIQKKGINKILVISMAKHKHQFHAVSWKGLATALGVFSGVYLGLAALLASMNMSLLWFTPSSFATLQGFYPSLTATAGGALLGLLMGALCGAFCGAVLALLYNWGTGFWK